MMSKYFLLAFLILSSSAYAVSLQPESIGVTISGSVPVESAFRIVSELNESSASLTTNCIFPVAMPSSVSFDIFANVFFNISDQRYMPDGEYPCAVFVQTGTGMAKLNVTIVKSMQAEASVANIVAQNEMGSELTVYLNITGGSVPETLRYGNRELRTPPFQTLAYPIQLNITQSVGWHNSTESYDIVVDNKSTHKAFSLAVFVADTTPPRITVADETQAAVLLPYKLFLRIKDGDSVKSVKARVYRGNRSEDAAIVSATPDEYELDFIPWEYGNTLIQINATDPSGNEAHIDHGIFIDYVKDFRFVDAKFTQIAKGLFMGRRFFESPVPLDVETSLKSFNYYPDGYENVSVSNYTLVVDSDGKQQEITDSKPYIFAGVHNMSLFFRGGVVGNFNGEIELKLPASTGDTAPRKIVFSGHVDAFTVPENFDGKMYDVKTECRAVIGKTEAESEYPCTFHYPIRVSSETLTFPITPAERDKLKLINDRDIAQSRKIAGDATARADAFTGLFIVSLLFGVYSRFLRGKKMFVKP